MPEPLPVRIDTGVRFQLFGDHSIPKVHPTKGFGQYQSFFRLGLVEAGMTDLIFRALTQINSEPKIGRHLFRPELSRVFRTNASGLLNEVSHHTPFLHFGTYHDPLSDKCPNPTPVLTPQHRDFLEDSRFEVELEDKSYGAIVIRKFLGLSEGAARAEYRPFRDSSICPWLTNPVPRRSRREIDPCLADVDGIDLFIGNKLEEIRVLTGILP
jgi:hypothetical protein